MRSRAAARPDDPRVLRTWANAAYRAGALKEARRAADAWALAEDGPELHAFRGKLLDATGRKDAMHLERASHQSIDRDR